MKIGFVSAGIVALSCATAAHSATQVGFTQITTNGPTNVAGQLFANFSANGPLVRVVFSNNGPTASAIAGIYFDSGSTTDFASIAAIINTPPGVIFSAGGSPGALPAANQASPAFVTNISLVTTADSPPPQRGLNPGESLTVDFNLASGRSFANIEAQLASGDLRVGMHVISIGTAGQSESYVSTPPGTIIPLPSAGLMGLAGLGVVASRRRR